jgi:hypothetical protein
MSKVYECGLSAYRRPSVARASRALSIYLVTSSIAVLGVFMGLEYFKPSGHILYERRDVLSTFANWDGNWYLQIARDGYKYDRDRNSSVGFFPGYPIMARYVASAAGLSTVSSIYFWRVRSSF